MNEDMKKQIKAFEKLNETNHKFTTSTTVTVFKDPQLMTLQEQHEWQRCELFRRYEQLLPNKMISPIIAQSICSSASPSEPTNTPLLNK
ncbi:unnamed protein product [Adineta steineri]|uniref:Uncharacterized protein n=1 Tax=Adineta steineri TaxID=433720 RepID=A0A820QRK5_9BILA|nr:unnamed protein product [Adineta steineri]